MTDTTVNAYQRFEAALSERGVTLQAIADPARPNGLCYTLQPHKVIGGPRSGDVLIVWKWDDGGFQTYYADGSNLVRRNLDLLTESPA